MSDQPEEYDVTESDPTPHGNTGASSERIGHAGPGQAATTGVRDTSPPDVPAGEEPPEQSPGGPEDNPDGLDPKAGYPTLDPRSE